VTIESSHKIFENETARETKTKIERIQNKNDVKEILDKHLEKFSGEITVVKSYVKDGKKIRVIKIKKKKNQIINA